MIVYVRTYVCMYASMYVYMYVYEYICICIYVCMILYVCDVSLDLNITIAKSKWFIQTLHDSNNINIVQCIRQTHMQIYRQLMVGSS